MRSRAGLAWATMAVLALASVPTSNAHMDKPGPPAIVLELQVVRIEPLNDHPASKDWYLGEGRELEMLLSGTFVWGNPVHPDAPTKVGYEFYLQTQSFGDREAPMGFRNEAFPAWSTVWKGDVPSEPGKYPAWNADTFYDVPDGQRRFAAHLECHPAASPIGVNLVAEELEPEAMYAYVTGGAGLAITGAAWAGWIGAAANPLGLALGALGILSSFDRSDDFGTASAQLHPSDAEGVLVKQDVVLRGKDGGLKVTLGLVWYEIERYTKTYGPHNGMDSKPWWDLANEVCGYPPTTDEDRSKEIGLLVPGPACTPALAPACADPLRTAAAFGTMKRALADLPSPEEGRGDVTRDMVVAAAGLAGAEALLAAEDADARGRATFLHNEAGEVASEDPERALALYEIAYRTALGAPTKGFDVPDDAGVRPAVFPPRLAPGPDGRAGALVFPLDGEPSPAEVALQGAPPGWSLVDAAEAPAGAEPVLELAVEELAGGAGALALMLAVPAAEEPWPDGVRTLALLAPPDTVDPAAALGLAGAAVTVRTGPAAADVVAVPLDLGSVPPVEDPTPEQAFVAWLDDHVAAWNEQVGGVSAATAALVPLRGTTVLVVDLAEGGTAHVRLDLDADKRVRSAAPTDAEAAERADVVVRTKEGVLKRILASEHRMAAFVAALDEGAIDVSDDSLAGAARLWLATTTARVAAKFADRPYDVPPGASGTVRWAPPPGDVTPTVRKAPQPRTLAAWEESLRSCLVGCTPPCPGCMVAGAGSVVLTRNDHGLRVLAPPPGGELPGIALSPVPNVPRQDVRIGIDAHGSPFGYTTGSAARLAEAPLPARWVADTPAAGWMMLGHGAPGLTWGLGSPGYQRHGSLPSPAALLVAGGGGLAIGG